MKHRTDRLQRLLALGNDCPDFLLVAEAMLIFESALSLAPEQVGKKLADLMMLQVRKSMGKCANADCEGEIPQELKDPLICEDCAVKLAHEMEECDEDFPEEPPKAKDS